MLGDAQHLGDVRHRAARLERREPAHHRRVPRPVLGEDQPHHVVLAVVGKIHIDVRQLVQQHPVPVQKPAEIQVEPHRAHPANPQAIAHQRIGGAAARDPADPLAAARLEQIPHHQEIFLVPHLVDHRQLLLELRPHRRRARPVPRLSPGQHELAQEPARVHARRHGKRGKLNPPRPPVELALARDLVRLREQLRMFAKQRPQFPRRAQMLFPSQPLGRMLLAQQRARADALHHVVLPAIPRRAIPHGQTRHQRHARRRPAQILGPRDLQIKPPREQRRPAGIRTQSNQVFGLLRRERRPAYRNGLGTRRGPGLRARRFSPFFPRRSGFGGSGWPRPFRKQLAQILVARQILHQQPQRRQPRQR